MLLVVQTALELGFLYAPVALALFLSFRVLDIADLTTDGCFVLGAAVSVTLTAAGHPLLAVPAAMLAGACAGFITAFLQTRLSVPSILAGIVTNTGLYTINLMAMGWRSNESLLGSDTVFTLLRSTGLGGNWYELVLAAAVTLLCAGLLALFLGTRLGLSIRHRRQSRYGPGLVAGPHLYRHRGAMPVQCADGSVRCHGGTVSENRGHQLRHRHRGHRTGVSHHRRDRAGPPHGV